MAWIFYSHKLRQLKFFYYEIHSWDVGSLSHNMNGVTISKQNPQNQRWSGIEACGNVAGVDSTFSRIKRSGRQPRRPVRPTPHSRPRILPWKRKWLIPTRLWYCVCVTGTVIGSLLCYPETVSAALYLTESTPEKVRKWTCVTENY